MTPADRLRPLAIVASFVFTGRHLLAVTALCLATAVARFAQTSGHAPLRGTLAQVLLEVLVEGGRVALAVLVIGRGSLPEGVRMIRRFIAGRGKGRPGPADGRAKQRIPWPSIALDLVLYGALAFGLNLVIDTLVRSAWVQQTALALGVAADNRTPAELFFKNVSVIPLTIVFQIFLIRRLWTRGAAS